ncbi:hypothetical protein BDK51DRAFT_45596, partial [Blyttiomyces helicus]
MAAFSSTHNPSKDLSETADSSPLPCSLAESASACASAWDWFNILPLPAAVVDARNCIDQTNNARPDPARLHRDPPEWKVKLPQLTRSPPSNSQAFDHQISPGIPLVSRSFINLLHRDDVEAVTAFLDRARSTSPCPSLQKHSKHVPHRSTFQTLIVTAGVPCYETCTWSAYAGPLGSLALVAQQAARPLNGTPLPQPVAAHREREDEEMEEEVTCISTAKAFDDFFEDAPISLH